MSLQQKVRDKLGDLRRDGINTIAPMPDETVIAEIDAFCEENSISTADFCLKAAPLAKNTPKTLKIVYTHCKHLSTRCNNVTTERKQRVHRM